jgi:hypothetical protein
MQYKKLGVHRLFKGCGSHQSSLHIDCEVAPKSRTTHTATIGSLIHKVPEHCPDASSGNAY